MQTDHQILFTDARRLRSLPAASIALVVTSPPYPMIEMWDAVFAKLDRGIADLLAAGRGFAAYERMHRLLDPVWAEVYRVLIDGGIVCINIGDATRSVQGRFRLYPNHARIVSTMTQLGFDPLPAILWRKQTNAPNKFMGSGMLPGGAYVTLEHEYILIFRKGGPRRFAAPAERRLRRRSALFWEERNRWFSDLWLDVKGASQKLSVSDQRRTAAAFPFEVPYRLILMYSVIGDRVLDPFLGTGTTMLAAMACARHSTGVEIDPGLGAAIRPHLSGLPSFAVERLRRRLDEHRRLVEQRTARGKPLRHRNARYDLAVVTGQETDMRFWYPASIRSLDECAYRVEYAEGLPPTPVQVPLELGPQ